jgi:hypothetical protein
MVEPEGVLIDGPDDPTAREAAGDIYEVLLHTDGKISSEEHWGVGFKYWFTSEPKRNLDLFNAKTLGGYHMIVASEAFVEQLQPVVRRWLEFTRVSGT